MIISHSKKIVFFHMYKVAGKSITSLLQENGGEMHWEISGQHTSCREALEHNKYKALIKEYYTFAFVRNPWDWVLSNYLYAKSCKIHPRYETINNSGMSFEGYIQKIITDQYIGPQFNFLMDKDESIDHFDFIGRFENLNDDILFLVKKLKLEGGLPYKNKTEIKSGSYRDHYTEKTKKQVEEIFAKDIEVFNYEF